MPHSGSAFSASSNTFCEARYQNECWYSIAWSNCFCASGLHEVSKWTLPSLLSSAWARAGWERETLIAASVTAEASKLHPDHIVVLACGSARIMTAEPASDGAARRLSGNLNLRLGRPTFFLCGALWYRQWSGRERRTGRDLALSYSRTAYLTPIAANCAAAALVPVEPQVFDLLVHLIRHRDQVVTKDDLLAAVWQGRIVSNLRSSTASTPPEPRSAIPATNND